MRSPMLGFAVAVVLFVALGSGCNPDKNKLLFKPQQGAKRIVDTENAINFDINLMGMKMGFGTSTEITFDMTTQAVDELGNSTIDVAYKSFAYEMTGLDAMLGAGMPGGGAPGSPQFPGMPKGDDPLGTNAMKVALKTVEGQSFTVKVNKLGEVTEVIGADAIAEKAASAFKAPASAAPMSPRQIFNKTLGDAAMKTMLQNIFTARPDKKLNAGDTWQAQSASGDSMMEVRQDATYTLKERAAGNVNVESVAKMDFTPQADLVKEMGKVPGLKIEITGQGTGTLTFDEATGWLADGMTTGQIPGTISAQVPQMGDMKIPVEVSYKTTVKTYPS